MQFVVVFIIFGLAIGLAVTGFELLIGGGKKKDLRKKGGLILVGAVVLSVIGYLVIRLSGFW
jgi:hypothetical protein